MSDEKKEEKKPMTVAEAGRRGGLKVREQRGREFYAQIGKKGGEAVARTHGAATANGKSEFYANIGKKGGAAVKAARGPDFFANIGKKGGDAAVERARQLEAEGKGNFYSTIGAKGGNRIRDLVAKAKAMEAVAPLATKQCLSCADDKHEDCAVEDCLCACRGK